MNRDEVQTFRAIRYAESERFGPPVAVPFSEPARGSPRGPVCPQHPSRLEPINGPQAPMIQDERCQLLTVSTRSRSGSRPVIIWLHGGAYLTGGGELPWYDGDLLVNEHDVVFVSVSYRLGALGYLRCPGSTGPSNGLADQVEALKWVQANISRFGGDPDRVTLAGQSAGAHSIQALIEWGHGGTLFQRAIAHSCPAVPSVTQSVAEKTYHAFTAALQCDLNLAPIHDILAAQESIVAMAPSELPFSPTQPPDIVTGERVDILASWTKQDAGFFVLRGRDPSWLQTPEGLAVTEAATDALFRRGADGLIEASLSSGGDAEMLRIDWGVDDVPWGASHCVELPLLLGQEGAWSRWPDSLMELSPEQRDAGRAMRRLWANVAVRERGKTWTDAAMLRAAKLVRGSQDPPQVGGVNATSGQTVS